MATKDMILGKLQTLITQDFNDPKAAFAFFDEDGNGTLSKTEIVRLLKKAEISGLIRGFVANKLIEGYSKDGDEEVSWNEFKAALDEIKE
ncbi:EF-hand domain-containing protein [Dokdonia ponticola]|uniref:EF-hand domain-containing protein n=1 Tax=Dokdonia ponticola TaxID=2041041 RepID=A0ABV9HTI7_9FLAO